MKGLSKIVLTVICYLISFLSSAQNITNKGKEFWVSYGHHQFMETGSNTQNMVLYLSAEDQPATVTITLDSSGIGGIISTWYTKTYNIPANTVISTENLPKGSVDAGPSGSNLKF